MKLKKSIQTLLISSVAALAIVGCGSSDDSTQVVAPTTLTGTFIDAPTQGLSFKTVTQSGFTDANGHFKYVAGEEVEFKLGNLSLGKGTAGVLVTPYTISENNDTATNIALLLQNFDGDRSDSGVLDLSKLKDFSFTLSDFNLSVSPATIKGKIDVLFADSSFAQFRDATNNTVLDETAVKGAMDEYIESSSAQYDKKFTQGFLDAHDFYTMDDNGPLIMRFDNGELYYAGDSYEDAAGQIVQGSGFNGTFNIDGSGIASYTLADGVVTIGYGGGNFMVDTTITNITDTYIEVYQSATTGESKTTKWYTDKEEAITNTITAQYGFGEKAIKGKDLYAFVNMDGSYQQFNIHFSDAEQSFQFINLADNSIVENQYTLDSNGSINWTDEDGLSQFNALEATTDYILVPAQTTLSERANDSLGNLKLYFTKEDMLTAYNNR